MDADALRAALFSIAVASLNGSAFGGAGSMVLFAAGSGFWLLAAPPVVAALNERPKQLRSDLDARLTGLLLAVSALFAIWGDVAHRIAQWCGLG